MSLMDDPVAFVYCRARIRMVTVCGDGSLEGPIIGILREDTS